MTRAIVAAVLCAAAFAPAAAGATPAAPITLVACAPGYPGGTEQAQPTMDAFAAALAAGAGWPAASLGAVYHETLEGGVARLARDDAALALVPLEFYLPHRAALDLRPIAEVDDGRWALVAKRGAVSGPADLDGMTVEGVPGYAPEFVRRVALAGFGPLPDDVDIAFSGRVLSSLRNAARGKPVAVLLDEEQTDALPGLPFGADLEVVARSAPLPASVVCRVGRRIDDAPAAAVVAALLALGETPDGREVLAELRVPGFRSLDADRIAAAEAAYAGAGR